MKSLVHASPQSPIHSKSTSKNLKPPSSRKYPSHSYHFSQGERAQVDQMEGYLKDRQQQLDKVSTLMTDVLGLAKDMNIEVKVQGEKLEAIGTEMDQAKENVERGNE